MVLVFELLILSFHFVQYSCTVSMAFWSPSLVVERRTISSAYASALIMSTSSRVTGSQFASCSFLKMSQKFTVSQSDKIVVNHWNILDPAPWSGQGRGIKCIYLDSPKVGDSADISFIP